MIIKKDNKVSVLAGRESFRSAFRNSKRKVRNLAHRRLIEELKRRGYYSNGKKPAAMPDMPDIPRIGLNDVDVCEQITRFWDSMQDQMQSLETVLKKLTEPSEPTQFWENPETGQRFSMESLIAATDLWPLDEVLALIP